MTQDNKGTWEGQDIDIGLDVHLRSWKVAIMTEAVSWKIFSQDPDPELLVRYLKKHFPDARYRCVYEAGYCGFWIQRALSNLGVETIVINPADVPTTDKERVKKTDRVDARKLAQGLRDRRLRAIYVPSETALSDRLLVRTRWQLTKKQTRVKNQIKAMLRYMGIAQRYDQRYWSKAFLSYLRRLAETDATLGASGRMALRCHLDELEALGQSILEVTQQIRDLASDDRYKNKVRLLSSLSGVSLAAAMILLTELVEIRRFRNLDHLAGFVGLVPSEHSTGDRERVGELTRRRNGRLLHVLIESAWTASRNDAQLALSFTKLCSRMPRNQAIIRIARKQLARIRYVLMNECPLELT